MLSWVCSTIIVLDPRFVCSSLTSNRGQQFVVRSEKFRGFQLFRSTSAFTWKKKKSTCAPPSWIIQKTGVLHFKHKMWLKDWFQDFTSRMFVGHTWELSNRDKKSVEGVKLPKTALPEEDLKLRLITSVTQSTTTFFVLTTFWRYLKSIIQQTHSSMESEYLLHYGTLLS